MGGFVAKEGEGLILFSSISWKSCTPPSCPVFTPTASLCRYTPCIPLSSLLFSFFSANNSLPFFSACVVSTLFLFPDTAFGDAFYIPFKEDWTKAMATTKTVTNTKRGG